MARFGEVLTAMVTPFADDGSLDVDAAVALARWLTDHGSDGLVVAGTTGESPVLTDAEKLDLWRAVAQAVTVPVIAGSGSNDTRHSVELTRRASETGVAGILAVTPYYNRPPQAGIEAHMRAIAAATELPVVLYDVPARTGRKVSHDVLVRLAREVANVVVLKDAAGDPPATARLVADAPEGFEVYGGDDAFTLPLIGVGAVGTIGVATHWCGEQVRQMLAAFGKGDVAMARAVDATLHESYAFAMSNPLAPSPMPAKAMMRALGHRVGECRLPMGPAPAGLDAEAAAVLVRLDEATAALGRHG